MEILNPPAPGIIPSSGQVIYVDIIPINNWNMDAQANYNVVYSIPHLSVLSIEIIIYSDSNFAADFFGVEETLGIGGYISAITDTGFLLTRATGGWFDSPAFSAATGLRGQIKVTHT